MDSREENEELYKIDENAMVLLASDVHIGALRTNISLFNDFLTKIIGGLENNYLKNLKALIILGDCFDIIMDTYEDFYENSLYNDTLNKLNTLYKRDDFKLIFALGNHEVSVKDDYDKNFFIEKSSFLTEFNRVNKIFKEDYTFLTKQNFSQYVILKNGNSSAPELFLYDTKQQIAEDRGRQIQLDIEAPTTQNYNILLTHGFQFDSNLGFFSKVWDFALRVRSKKVKEIADAIWNGFFKVIYSEGKRLKNYFKIWGDKLKKRAKRILDETTNNYDNKYNLKITKLEKTQLDELIEKMYKSDKHREDIKENSFNKQVRTKFLPELSNLGYTENFNYIIYGHTHRRWPRRWSSPFIKRRLKPIHQQTSLFKIKDTYLFNTGAWQHVNYPSFIQVDSDWNISLVDIKTTVRKAEDIIDKPLSQRLVQNITRQQQSFQPPQGIQKKQAQQKQQESDDIFLNQ